MTKNIDGDIYSDLITSANPNVMNSSPERAKIDRIVIHHNATTNKDVAMNTWLKGGAANTSAHYEIADGEIIGCVGENFTAWHAGNWDMNLRSIGLEHKNSTMAPSWQVSEATMNASAKLIADICKRYAIPIDRTHIIKHSEVYATACPGGLNIDELVKRAKAIASPAPATPAKTAAPAETVLKNSNLGHWTTVKIAKTANTVQALGQIPQATADAQSKQLIAGRGHLYRTVGKGIPVNISNSKMAYWVTIDNSDSLSKTTNMTLFVLEQDLVKA
ncbi:peptidoglycan recognition protein family protein [Lactococcus insecticola]|uniref:N-acetylmuramoyl-L-alanine amidase n=1 Tax=Pseudolactococcus insecticola TaxID=2709158 RepID=A0A6A0B3E1_9LACT|nr:peptidoglycan recognition family protein [Lactococcus insecticola]GFH39859.1 hypothetical protein Hs20B_02570 [Lactococcus insecticola]